LSITFFSENVPLTFDLLGYPDKVTKHNTKHNICELFRAIEGPDAKKLFRYNQKIFRKMWDKKQLKWIKNTNVL